MPIAPPSKARPRLEARPECDTVDGENRDGLHPSRLYGESMRITLVCRDWEVTPVDIDCPCFIMTSMRTAKTISITLPPDLLVMAQALAEREHRTMSELFRETGQAWGSQASRMSSACQMITATTKSGHDDSGHRRYEHRYFRLVVRRTAGFVSRSSVGGVDDRTMLAGP